MSMSFDDLELLAERCLSIVKGMDPEREEIARDALESGEPDLPISIALGISQNQPELYAEFPDEVIELAKDPSWDTIHPYLDLLERHRGGKPA